jgi:hypothetical protein
MERRLAVEAWSVCIDAGNPSIAGMPLPVLDLDGNQRIAGGRIDMGAYEFPQTQGVAEAATARIGGLFPIPAVPILSYDWKTKGVDKSGFLIFSVIWCTRDIIMMETNYPCRALIREFIFIEFAPGWVPFLKKVD